MSRFLGSGVGAKQPRVPCPIARSNPIARGLGFAHNGATIHDHARNVRPTDFPHNLSWWQFAPTLLDTAVGTELGEFTAPLHAGVNAEVGKQLNYQGFPAIGGDITLFALAYAESNFGNGGAIFAFSDETNDRGCELHADGNNVISAWIAESGGNWNALSGPAYADGDIFGVTLVLRSGQPAKLYTTLSGTVYTSAGNYGNANAQNSSLCIGAYKVGGVGTMLGCVGCALLWDRALSEPEIRSVMRVPWQVFYSPKQFPVAAIAVVVQTAYPISDVSNSGWSASSGSDLYAMIGESVRNDATYIYATVPGAICEEQLTALGDPNSSIDHLPTLVLSAPGGGGITVRLREGTTTIASWTYYPPSTPTVYQPTLTGTEANSIGSYSALKYQIEAIA